MILQRQPTRTSCGPTSVAMIVDRPVREVLEILPAVRISPARQKRRDDRANVGEMRRLFAAYGWRLGRRIRVAEYTHVDYHLVRWPHFRGSGWHWLVCHKGRLFDPCRARPRLATVRNCRGFLWYPVERTTL